MDVARHWGLSTSGYRRPDYGGRYPGPVPSGRKVGKHVLDLALDRLSGIERKSVAESDEFAECAAKGVAKRRGKHSKRYKSLNTISEAT